MERDPLNNLASKYAKRLLTKLESSVIVTPEIRKAVLDELNSMAREFARSKEKQDGIRKDD
jgi:hypothetical protein